MNNLWLRCVGLFQVLLWIVTLLWTISPARAGEAHEEARRLHVVGSAYDRDGGTLLYSEYHYCSERDTALCSVEYRDASDRLIAYKALDYRESAVGPSLVMRDLRQDLEIRAGANGEENLVVDAGFDNFVRDKWDVLEGDESVQFPFLVAGFDRPLRMSARKASATACSEDELCLSISLDSWLLGLLSDPIELAYSREERRLLRFRGVSNIRGARGESLDVDIHYRYPDKLLLADALESGSIAGREQGNPVER